MITGDRLPGEDIDWNQPSTMNIALWCVSCYPNKNKENMVAYIWKGRGYCNDHAKEIFEG